MHPAMQGIWVLDSIVRCLCVIPLLPSHRLNEGLLSVGVWAERVGWKGHESVRALFVYMDNFWMRKRDILSVLGCEERTNNVSESAYAGLDWFVPQDRPNVFQLISR